ncbi:MAG: Asp-tRNA(Asn)/Glu-tRNA(Gln) amidotransferase subunit GatB [Lachnoclostridium sp.]|nr:Asp-tRNA(Asn)/Glu-tRNA(Gln) amidotransferase subunit GatB [Lachnospira sp.]MCM1248959.1 Asp-tRNA(Asn)/Glu-tRNA(Gln) amidotransferase subunit GatB [Lachnoclostridium sp.]
MNTQNIPIPEEKQYETVIGLEVHVELATKTKIFCGCSTAFGAPANTHVCPVCMGMPGALPVLNRQVVEYAIAVGLATNCKIDPISQFDRKNYFYPDNPQSYQISQLYKPLCRDGYVETDASGKIRIREIHMEEDAGKLIHKEEEGCSLVDFNRAGVPLIEIVSEPDMRDGEEVIAYLEKLRTIIRYLGASDCKMQEGSMRADVNLSVRKRGSEELGTRTEMKNLSSFRAVRRAVEWESRRQIALLEAGQSIVQETRRWDEGADCSYVMRSKENAQDYRYFPEPDLLPIRISAKWLKDIKARQPELPDEKRMRYKKEFALSDYDIAMITQSRHLAEIFEETAALCGQPKKAANWIMGETLRLLKEREMEPEEIRFTPKNLAALIDMTEKNVINSTIAKEVFEVMFDRDMNPVRYVESQGLKTVYDTDALRKAVAEVIASNPESVADYRNGKERAIGFLVGQTMKLMKGKADPASVNLLLRELLQTSR